MSPPSLVWRLPLLISIPWVQQVSSGTVSMRDRKRDVSRWRHFLYFVISLGVFTHLEHGISLGWINSIASLVFFNISSCIQRFGQEAIAQHKLDRSTDRRQVRCLRILIPDEDTQYHLAIMTNRRGIRWIHETNFIGYVLAPIMHVMNDIGYV